MSADVKPDMLLWACERAGRSADALARQQSLCKLPAWVSGKERPTFKQLEKFARATYTPFGYFFLPKPPDEFVPIPDLRTVDNRYTARPSPDMLETIYTMQRRQAWLRETLIECEAEPLGFVGSARLTDDPNAIGREMRRIVNFGNEWAAKIHTWKDAVGELRRAIEQLGVMAVINGVVGNNTHRKLDVKEFRGFALCDIYAPLIFINGADAKSAQMFSLVHELAHIWLGREGVSGFEGIFAGGKEVEDFCDQAAAEFLVPARELIEHWRDVKNETQPFERLAGQFKVSPIVAGRRAMDLRLVDRELFFTFYNEYLGKERSRSKGPGGGDFYNSQNNRVGEMFAIQVIRAAKEGRVGFKDAYDLTGLRGGAFQEYAYRLGFNLP
ncbi:MAG: ImmA/IrrE family metallo-endopeptidase [Verrucomicrobia bacterium]|nr:ImmA/IrrE family metallo-endopeptidase [Verrucomicrobiota bacterium]MCF7707382.1 ImmA/IrrE family metallo-endopeptidase [Verrucomicrobiota bacterium]